MDLQVLANMPSYILPVMRATRWICIKTNGSWYNKKNET